MLQLGSTLSPTTVIISSFLLETSTMLGDLCFFFFIFARVLYSFFLFENHPVIRGSNSKNSGAGNIRESLLLNHQRLPSSSPSFYCPRLFLHRFSPTFDPSYTFFFFLHVYSPHHFPLQACEPHLAAKECELAINDAVRTGLVAYQNSNGVRV